MAPDPNPVTAIVGIVLCIGGVLLIVYGDRNRVYRLGLKSAIVGGLLLLWNLF